MINKKKETAAALRLRALIRGMNHEPIEQIELRLTKESGYKPSMLFSHDLNGKKRRE